MLSVALRTSCVPTRLLLCLRRNTVPALFLPGVRTLILPIGKRNERNCYAASRLPTSSVCLLTALLLSVPLPAFPQNKKEKDPDASGDRNVSGKVNFYSLEKEIGLGKQLAQDVERQSKVINDPVISEYVNRLGQNLVRNSDAKVPFAIKVIEDPTVNAFALPGGFFFV